MKMYLLIIIICICLLASAEFCSCNNNDATTTCPVEHCNHKDGPETRFPFSLKGKKYQHQCVYPRSGFELYCSDHGNHTLLDIPFPELNSSSFNLTNLPRSVELIVKEIDYASQSILLSVADANCIDGYTLLDLSATPFEQQQTIDYTFFNCSNVSLPSYSMNYLPCLGGSTDRVYAIESDSDLYLLASSCTKMFNILSSRYPLYAENFQLDWNMPNCGVCERKSRACRLKNNGTALETECVREIHRGNGEEFINEVRTIGKIHHVNVVRLIGYCADGYRRCLVYEFLPNESLQKLISSENQIRALGWEKLLRIAIDIAKGIEYLHQGCNQRILHFDIKPHNILLDKNFNPKVADFGLAKLCSKEQSRVSMTAARGTVGYIAPEVFSRNYGNVSYKADIYSFGMLLLDMVGGRKDFRAAGDDNSSEVYFPEWMYNQLEKGEEIAIRIEKEEDDKVIKKLTVAGLWCIQWYPVDRPTMKDVIQMIEGDGVPTMPPNPFASTKMTTSAANASTSRFNFNTTLENISEGD